MFAAPTGVSWTLPLYELALLSWAELDRRGLATEVVILTPEALPLEVFGTAAGITSLAAGGAGRPPAPRIRAERRAAATSPSPPARRSPPTPSSRCRGWSAGGSPESQRTGTASCTSTAHGRVIELDDVFAAGDVTQFPVKQGASPLSRRTSSPPCSRRVRARTSRRRPPAACSVHGCSVRMRPATCEPSSMPRDAHCRRRIRRKSATRRIGGRPPSCSGGISRRGWRRAGWPRDETEP